MSWPEKALVVVLRASGVVLLAALGAVVMPHDWMAATHEWLGLGDLPRIPIIGYLTRSASALYAFHGALELYMSFDVRRYLPLIRCLAWVTITFGLIMLAIDAAVRMPPWWTIGEGPCIAAVGAVELWLAGLVERDVRSS